MLVSVVTVPIIEELFWRGWMMRWIADHHFTRIPVGTYHAEAFWIVALLFASEHGSYWDVGLVTGVIYNWWVIRTKNLTDCVIAHAVTNGCLAIYVIGWGQWRVLDVGSKRLPFSVIRFPSSVSVNASVAFQSAMKILNS